MSLIMSCSVLCSSSLRLSLDSINSFLNDVVTLIIACYLFRQWHVSHVNRLFKMLIAACWSILEELILINLVIIQVTVSISNEITSFIDIILVYDV